jgi:hypothetical protein
VTKKARISADVAAAWVEMYEGAFLALMQGILKATSVEEEYAGLHSDVRHATQEEMHRLAHVAAERFVMLANPGLSAASKEEIDAWKREAIEYAIRNRK